MVTPTHRELSPGEFCPSLFQFVRSMETPFEIYLPGPLFQAVMDIMVSLPLLSNPRHWTATLQYGMWSRMGVSRMNYVQLPVWAPVGFIPAPTQARANQNLAESSSQSNWIRFGHVTQLRQMGHNGRCEGDIWEESFSLFRESYQKPQEIKHLDFSPTLLQPFYPIG